MERRWSNVRPRAPTSAPRRRGETRMSFFDINYRNGKLALAGAVLLVGAGAFGGGCGGGISTEAEFCQALAEVQCSQAVVTACYGSSDVNLDANTESCISSRSLSSRCNP